MTTAVETIFRKINALKSKDRLALEHKLVRRMELEWKKQIGPIREEARKRKIDQNAIDTAISKHRYGK